jgi:hypothetical protein
MTYDDMVAALMTMNEVPFNQADENFERIIPTMIEYAEGRIYRELTVLVITQPTTLIARNRELALPTSVRVLRGINIITPIQKDNVITLSGKRKPLERIPPDVLDFFWPDASFRLGPPQKYAVIGTAVPDAVTVPQTLHYTIRFMPTPDQAYMAELLGEIRPLPLAPENPETFLSVFYPNLLIAACMIFASGYQRDFSAQAEDPQRAMSWEGQYKILLSSAMLEAARMRGEGPGYTADTPAPLAGMRAPG